MNKFWWVSLILACVLLVPTIALGVDFEASYEEAMVLLGQGKFDDASIIFASLGYYKDASRYTMYCRSLSAGENGYYSNAIVNLSNLDEFLDSEILIIYYTGLQLEYSEKYKEAYDTLVNISLYRDVLDHLSLLPDKIKAQDYDRAQEAVKNGKLEEAIELFKELGDYLDSNEQVITLTKEKQYIEAIEKEANKQYQLALDLFVGLGDYKDSAEHVDSLKNKLVDVRRAFTNAKVNWRSEPSSDAARIGTLTAGTLVVVHKEVATEAGNWAWVECDGEMGYVKAEFLDYID